LPADGLSLRRWTVKLLLSFPFPLLTTALGLIRVTLSSISFSLFSAHSSIDSGKVMAGVFIAAIPMTIAFLFYQRYFLKWIPIGTFKG
jgi:ABC-type glycerol-3-phosphate transport system permease component